MPRDRWPRGARLGLLVALLAFENVWFFHGHYAGTVTFPYDFSNTYHAVPFYWQAAARAGHIPQWMPFQAFGYPLALDLQSGLYYPPLWLFPVAGLTFSLRAAAILQCLHVFAGGLGAYLFSRARMQSYSVGLVAAVAYSGFGGFFCNAQHVDIVRAYALVPFLFAALTVGGRGRALAVVPVVYALATGAYPGGWLAALTFGGGYLVVQLGEHRRYREIAWRAASMGLGLGLAAASIVPGFAMRGEISRVDQVGELALTGLGVDHWFTALFSADSARLSGDISMRSLFVGAPLVLGLCLLRRAEVRRQRALVAIAAAALVMAGGGHVFALVSELIPPLGYSRFPAADYRALVALPVVVLGAAGLVGAIERADLSWRRIAGGVGAFATLVAIAAWRLDAPLLGVALVTAALVAVLASIDRLPARALILATIVLAIADAHRVEHAFEPTWITAAPRLAYKRFAHELEAELVRVRTDRPARAHARYLLDGLAPDLDGYLRGHYTNDDYAASEHFRVVERLRAAPVLADYLIGASAPHLIDPVGAYTGATRAAQSPSHGATTVTYTPDRIEYRVAAPTAKLLVENEPVFAGWTATLDCDPARPAPPVRALWPLRAWSVAAGTERVCATYATPTRGLAIAISLVSLAIWLAAIAWRLARFLSGRARSRPA